MKEASNKSLCKCESRRAQALAQPSEELGSFRYFILTLGSIRIQKKGCEIFLHKKEKLLKSAVCRGVSARPLHEAVKVNPDDNPKMM